MLKLRRTESMNVDVRIFFADVLQKIDVPFKLQFRMMPALHQDLHSARSSKFVQLLIQLLQAQHVMIFIALGAIKRAELAINVADIRVIDVAIDDVSHDLAAAIAIAFGLCQIAARVRKCRNLAKAKSYGD